MSDHSYYDAHHFDSGDLTASPTALPRATIQRPGIYLVEHIQGRLPELNGLSMEVWDRPLMWIEQRSFTTEFSAGDTVTNWVAVVYLGDMP